MHGLMRFLQLLTMCCWVGGLVFFAFVLAPTAFHTLPTTHLAGWSSASRCADLTS